jgi:flagellar biosynthetic protein FliR
VKPIAMLVTLPIALGLSTGIALRLLRTAIESAPRLLGSVGG